MATVILKKFHTPKLGKPEKPFHEVVKAYVKQNFGILSIAEIAKHFRANKKTIENLAIEMGFDPDEFKDKSKLFDVHEKEWI